MVLAQPSTKLTFEDYLTLTPDQEGRYELVNGILVKMPPPTWRHMLIAKFLIQYLDEEIVKLGRVQEWTTLLEPGQRTKESGARLPDVAVVPWVAIADVLGSAVLTVPALLIIEIVSNNWRDDYLTKLAEYEELGISEYWIVDYQGLGGSRYIGTPKHPTLSIYRWVDGEYQVQQFRGQDQLISPTFPDLALTPDQVFKAGQVD
jgi:Uma2 family endonuclease